MAESVPGSLAAWQEEKSLELVEDLAIASFMQTMFNVLAISIIGLLGHCLAATQVAHPSTTEEAASCVVFVQNVDKSGNVAARGSGFIVQEGAKVWVYTNAHVIEGANKLIFKTQTGKSLQNFGAFQCYEDGFGVLNMGGRQGGAKNAKIIGGGGDGVRIELKDPVPIALKLAPSDFAIRAKLPVVTLGDNDGDSVLDTLKGEIAAFSPLAFTSTCQTKPGCSGGAVLDAETMKVIGLHTWGYSAEEELKPLNMIWRDNELLPEKVAGASLVYKAEWKEIRIGQFLAFSEKVEKLRETVKLMAAIYVMTPTKGGLDKLPYDSDVAPGWNVEKVFLEQKNSFIVEDFNRLNERLKKQSNIGLANTDVVKVYAIQLEKIRDQYAKIVRELSDGMPFYFRHRYLYGEGIQIVGSRCYASLGSALEWFQDKTGAGGVIPVGHWFADMPPLGELRLGEK